MNEQKKLKDINKNHQNEMDTLTSIEQLIINLNKENVAKTEITIINKCQDNYYSFNIIIAQIIYICFKIQHKHFDVYLKILKEIENFEEKQNKNKILVIFTEFLLAKKTQESYYILNQMIKANLIKPTILQNKTNPYFIHYLTEKEIKKLILNDDIKQILGNFEELSKNDWELHKKLIDEGVNPNEIAKIIRNDEIDNLQEIASQPNFDFDQTIAPSLYERCSYINKKNVTLIDYAAFLDQ